MNTIRLIELKHANPSMGPHETITTVVLSMSAEHKVVVADFLENAIVNGTINLNLYLEAIHGKNEKVLKKVNENSPKRDLPCGGKVSHLSFYFEGGDKITLSDVYRGYSLSNFYPTFTQYMVDNGILDKYSGWGVPGPGVIPPSSLDSSIEKIDRIPPVEE